jgi:tol-pal system protein YbgF
MHIIEKIFVAGGLVTVIGALSVNTLAQDYVDVEAERAAATQPVPGDPYAPRGAQTYPATSYGVSNAPAAPPGTSVAPATGTSAPVGAQRVSPQPLLSQSQGGQNLGLLFSQIQQLQQQVMELNGKLEEQAHELRTLKEQSLQRYVDLDKRISGGAAAGVAGATAPESGAPDNAIPAASTAIAGTAPVAAQAGEAEAYRAAYALVQSQRFGQAAQAFQQFQRNYPDGKYAPNAYYWLGELYLVVQPPDLESSRQAFTMLLSQYPDNSKAPDALYKLGKVQYMKGNREKAREYLDQVIRRYGSTNSSAVKLAKDFIAENY